MHVLYRGMRACVLSARVLCVPLRVCAIRLRDKSEHILKKDNIMYYYIIKEIVSVGSNLPYIINANTSLLYAHVNIYAARVCVL